MTCVHLNRLALHSLLKPEKFGAALPRRARPPPKLMPLYLDYDRRGYLSPEVQLRNKELFGSFTSESFMRAQASAGDDSNSEEESADVPPPPPPST